MGAPSSGKRLGKSAADAMFGGLLAARRAMPASLDDALFHLPRREIAAREAADASIVVLGTERVCTLPPAVDLRGARWAALDGSTDRAPQDLIVARVPRARVLGRRCAVVARGGGLVRELSPFLDPSGAMQHPELRRHAWLPRPRRVDGVVLVAGNAGAGNYYHWIVEGLRRLLETLRHAERIGIDLSRARVAVSRARLDAVDACLRRLGFGEDRVIRMGRFTQIEADEVVAASVPPCMLGMTPEAARTLRGFAPGSGGGRLPRRFVVLRRGLRSFIDDRVVLDSLAPFGFEPVRLESMDFALQQELFAHAEAVVAPHGAGLANLAWTRGPCEVLEVFPERYLNPCFRRICAASADGGRLRHSFLVSPPASDRADRTADRVSVDASALRAWAAGLAGVTR